MNPAYAFALEKRIEWLEWGLRHGRKAWDASGFGSAPLDAYIDTLSHGETFYMDEHFCRLVEHARKSVPDDLAFEVDWLIRPAGWLYLAESFKVPAPASAAKGLDCKECGHHVPPAVFVSQVLVGGGMTACPECGSEFIIRNAVRAIGWRPIPAGAQVVHSSHHFQTSDGQVALVTDAPEILVSPATQFLCFIDFSDYKPGAKGFGCWSYFLLRDGQKLGQRLIDFENFAKRMDPDGAYKLEKDSTYHEIRWIYAAMHLMAQRLSIQVQHKTHRSVRRRIEHSWHRPAPPFISVVTLRRLEAARPKHQPANVEWHWQWEVRGHWRNQWYAKEGIHKPKFIEAFIKGPPGLPFKTTGTKLFVARR